MKRLLVKQKDWFCLFCKKRSIKTITYNPSAYCGFLQCRGNTEKPGYWAIQQLLSCAQGKKDLREADLFLQVILHWHELTKYPCVKLSLDYYRYLYIYQERDFQVTEVRYELSFLPLSNICGLEKFTRKILVKPQIRNISADPMARCWGSLIMFFGNTES